MRDEIFADGIGEITITGPMVRIDLVSLSATERDGNNTPKQVFRQRIIMPVDSFMNAYDLMQRVAKELVESGAVRRQQSHGSGNGRTADLPRESPNFP